MGDDNVKVAVRVRPFNSREKERNSTVCIKMEGSTTYIRNPEDPPEAEPKKFAFDFSYWSHDQFVEQPDGYLKPETSQYADQMTVFEDLGKGVLANAWKGYNCSLFAYGQTGSGKSYSMVGYGVNKGIVPITCEELFIGIDKSIADGSKSEYQVTLSMMEIYNEQARDLLNPATLKIKGGMKVRQNPKVGFYVDGLSFPPVASYGDIEAKIEQGTKNRTVASTAMNATSSRAHTIVAIGFTQKGINEATGKNMTKTSVINLVDLAGSERADSTGATGDRLKEGSAINQSLSTLGNVIKALADASTGKGKVLIPFRDSVLTKLLKNALGGNSKTVMIAALSPADINYEETLGTLRFADRAKAIKTKAVVNESPTDKLIRELREENEKLQKALLAAAGDPAKLAALLSGEAPPQQGEAPAPTIIQQGVDEAEVEAMKKEMEEQLERRMKEMENMNKSWEQRLKEQEDKSKQEVESLQNENDMKKTTAHLWNLNEDTQLSNMITHFLKPGSHRVGSKKAQPEADITLTGLSVMAEHATIVHDASDNSIRITPGAQAKIMVNGVAIVDEKMLAHGDRILFGNSHLYVLHHPLDPELLRKREEAAKGNAPVEEVAVAVPVPTYEQAQEEIAQNSGLINYDDIGAGGKKSPEEILLQEDLLKILPMISEANAMSEELDKKVKFEPVLISPQARGAKHGRTEVFVKMKDLTNDNEWVWDKNKFINRKFIMQEIYQTFVEEETLPESPMENDPFWEPSDSSILIGTVHVYMQSLAYMIEIDEWLAISDYKGNSTGQLQVKVIPCTKSGQMLSEDDFVEDPSELVGQQLHFKVCIPSARGLPGKFSKGESFCSYQMEGHTDAVMSKAVQGTINPEYKHEKLFSFNPVTTQLTEYLMNKPLIVDVKGVQGGVTKKGVDGLSTKELMAMDGRKSERPVRQSVTSDSSDAYYKLQCDVNTYKRRMELKDRKLQRVQKLIEEQKKQGKTEISMSDLEEMFKKTDSMRFQALGRAVVGVEKSRKVSDAPGGQKQGSAACTLQ